MTKKASRLSRRVVRTGLAAFTLVVAAGTGFASPAVAGVTGIRLTASPNGDVYYIGDQVPVEYSFEGIRQGYSILLQTSASSSSGWQVTGSQTIMGSPEDGEGAVGTGDSVNFRLTATAVTAFYRAVLLSPSGTVLETTPALKVFVFPQQTNNWKGSSKTKVKEAVHA